jgi:hypothetical protein
MNGLRASVVVVVALSALACSASAASAVGLTDGLKIYWNMDGALANRAAGGSALNGTLVDGVTGGHNYVAGKIGQALDLDYPSPSLGNTYGDYVSANYTLEDRGTVALWYNPAPLYNYQTIFDNSSNGDDWEYWIYNSGQSRFRVESGTEVSGDVTGVGQWNHLAASWSRSGSNVQTRLYVNGQLKETKTGPWVNPGSQFFLGGGNSGNSYGTGVWDEVGVWNRTLSDGDVQRLYNGGQGLALHVPVIEWKFDGNLANSGSGGSAYDATIVDGPNGSNAIVSTPHGQGLDLGQSNYSTGGDYVSANYKLADQGTIALWYYAEPWYNYQTIFDNSINGDYWECWVYGDGLARFRVNNDNATAVDYDLDNLGGPRRWNHFAFTWQRDGANVDLAMYINGTLYKQNRALWRDPGTNFFLGGGHVSNTFGNGIWDEVQIYEDVLSLGEIRELAGVPEPGSLALLACGGLGLVLTSWRRRRGTPCH